MTQQELLKDDLRPCPACEQNISVNYLYCPICGQPSFEDVIAQSSVKKSEPCPGCGVEVPISYRFCPQCRYDRSSRFVRRRQSVFLISVKTVYDYIFEAKDGKVPLYEQFAMYFGLVLGVIFSSHLRGTQETTAWFLAAVTALVISPVAFDKFKLVPDDSPFFVKFGLFVQNGVFWDILFEAIGSKLN